MKYIITIIILLASVNTASAYDTMTSREYYKMQVSKKANSSVGVQNHFPMRFKKTGTEGFARYNFLAESAFRKRLLIGLRAAMLNNVRKNGRNFDAYFRADAARQASKKQDEN